MEVQFKQLALLKQHYNIYQIIEQEPNRIVWYESLTSKKKSAILADCIEVYDSEGIMIDRITI